ncbi:hypothetical protein [Alkanindiges illinoisensis]|uniref:hypothetical protein n=1 Tax=Alkanindiges illinoisensis TaxID=197183 RepID=UPI000684E6A0|nr:hypothetical protein [Alkanindiges illinoisensis]
MRNFKFLSLNIFALIVLSGCNQIEFATRNTPYLNTLLEQSLAQPNLQIDPAFRDQKLLLDLNGDGALDLVRVVKSTLNHKNVLEIIFGNQTRVEYLLAGKTLTGLSEDDLSIFQTYSIAPKHEKYVDLNVSIGENGDIPAMEDVPENELIYLENDGIDIGMLESCGGGIIYMKNNKFYWIQTS